MAPPSPSAGRSPRSGWGGLAGFLCCIVALAPGGCRALSRGVAPGGAVARPAGQPSAVGSPQPQDALPRQKRQPRAVAANVSLLQRSKASQPPAAPTVPLERPIDTLACLQLQTSLLVVDNTTTNASCTLLQLSFSSPRGCECKLIRHTSTWLSCPYDCSNHGGPACVAGTAKELGLTGLTSSRPVASYGDAGDQDDPFQEVTYCTYWQWGTATAPDPEPDDSGALTSGQQKASWVIGNISAEAELRRGAYADELRSHEAQEFTLPSWVDGGAPMPVAPFSPAPAPAPAGLMPGAVLLHMRRK